MKETDMELNLVAKTREFCDTLTFPIFHSPTLQYPLKLNSPYSLLNPTAWQPPEEAEQGWILQSLIHKELHHSVQLVAPSEASLTQGSPVHRFIPKYHLSQKITVNCLT